jgi:DNA replication protein DnaC
MPEKGTCKGCGGEVNPVYLPKWPGKPHGHWLIDELCEACTAEIERANQDRRQQAQTRNRWRESNLPQAAQDWNFDLAFDRAQAAKRDPADFALWHAAYRGVRYWHANRGVLYLFGSEGSGKTVLSWCLARQTLGAGESALWLSLPEFFDLVETAYGPGSPARELETRAKQAGLLLIDEVGGPGADRPRKRERDSFFRIINHRADHKRPIVITTNLPPADLANVFKDPFDRTIARLIKGDGVLVEGKSFRLIEAEGRW